MGFAQAVGGTRYLFPDLRTLLARATPLRSGDVLAGLAAGSAQERVAAQRELADLPLRHFLTEAVIPYEEDEVTRLILDRHDVAAFAPVAHLTVGGFRDWLLSEAASPAMLAALRPGLTPEMVAGVSKICRLQDLVAIAAKCQVTTRFRNTLGLPGRLSIRLQPNDPVDDPRGVAAAILDGLLLGAGDAVIGVNPATDSLDNTLRLLELLDAVRDRYAIPTQSCVLAHVTTTLLAIEQGAPVDLVFQSIGGTEATNRSFGVSLALLREAREAALGLGRGSLGQDLMYFETGQGSALSAEAHHGCDQQTIEARAYAVAREFPPLLVNSVVGFIGPEYLFDGKQITRAGLEDHCCGKLLGLPMGVDVCYTNHAEADQDDMDALLTLLGVAGVTYIMGVPGADDVMLAYQSSSFHDGRYLRAALGKRPAPEFAAWMERMGLEAASSAGELPPRLAPSLAGLA
ncbi:ethanolamine ammonia-lyase subunit EutB [Roseicella frigidaeris]|uniref:Ethanolamine ammonia-lyase large subunit n=1 Tax=Roseicella frigidaeris TaxID=2230885 RepID=A0A327MEE6_9PROT|nr:ethanolamine ammonia-lyase subunit EutB [Roseicella frigidaeris]RAI61047.1 ethanolamine ammonia lyase large subunit [Roseicella frigidaeris]